MFTVEAMLSARLNHPNIVQVFEFAEVAGERYLAMEYVHGINLGDLQKRLKGVPVPVAMAAHLVREISLALGYAHALPDDDGKPLSLIHRDVSPSNVMIGYDGGVKLLDFGVAKALSSTDELTRTGALKGKVAYMSPEAVDGELTLDGRTDIFAAGVVLYELLTGKRLFKGGDDLRTIALVRACKVDPPSKERPDIPAELDRIALKALARDRDQRYERADDLAADLNQVAHDLQWDATRTSLFLKQHDIQPGSEPELKPAPAGTGPSEASPATMQVTVLERRAGRSSTSLPAVGRPRLRWALLGAGGALLMASALAMATRWWADGAVAAPFSMPSLGSSRAAEPSRAQPVSPEPPSSAAATTPEPEIVPVPPASSPSSETATALAPVDTAESSRVANAEKSPARAKRRKRVSRPTPPPPEEPAKPQVDLKRGDVIRVF